MLLHEHNVMRGREGVGESGERLKRHLRVEKYKYLTGRRGEYFLFWPAESRTVRIEHGVDSFLIRDGAS